MHIAIWIKFEHPEMGNAHRKLYQHYKTPDIDSTWTTIFAITREFQIKSPRARIKRKQFPILQAIGKTVHKAQGSTINNIIIDLSDYIFRDAFYVACSRVTKIEGLNILYFDPKQIRSDEQIQQEMERLKKKKTLLVLNFPVYTPDEATFKIYYSNVQSLFSHFEYLKNDQTVKNSNILLLCATHLIPTESI